MAAFRPGAGRLTNDLAMMMVVVAVIALMVLPLPLWLIDTLLAVNLAVSVLLLMTTLFIPTALSLSTFPSLLLFTTLFRLSLNIASTKMILLHADAGHVIEAFGNLVAGGNLVVGMVVFLVITVVQFLVISKGSERVAEVGARFTLDAMPGKQMSIDADLRAGVITGEEAQKKRATLAMESQFHGGMDGAMKFVKGDTIAGLVITIINIVAGIIVGVMFHNMTTGEAATRFSVLSIGDAMVSQIPSLFICVASGVLITRVADEHEKKPKSLGQEMMGQISAHARAMQLAAVLVASFGMVPGFPAVPFVALAIAFGVASYYFDKKRRKEEAVVISKPIASLQREGARGEPPSIRLSPPTFAKPLAIRMSHPLALMLEADRLDEAMETERQRLQSHLGVPFPGVSMWVDKELAGSRFDVLLNDVPVREITVPGRLMYLSDKDSTLAPRAQKHGPLLGQSESLWLPADTPIPDGERKSVLDLDQVLARQVMDLLKQHAHLFMGVQEVQWVIDKAQVDYPGLVAEVQKILPLQRIAEVLRRLLEEQVPIRNVRTIFESLIAWGPKEKDMLMLTEYVRADLGRYLAFEASGGQGFVSAILVDPGIEQAVRSCIKPTPAGNFLAMPPEQTSAIAQKVCEIADSQPSRKGLAMVTSQDIRRYVRKMIEPRIDWLRVYSYQELGSLVELRPVGHVG